MMDKVSRMAISNQISNWRWQLVKEITDIVKPKLRDSAYTDSTERNNSLKICMFNNIKTGLGTETVDSVSLRTMFDDDLVVKGFTKLGIITDSYGGRPVVVREYGELAIEQLILLHGVVNEHVGSLS